MNGRKPIRQGDVLFFPVDEIPAEAQKLETNVIAEGEATGHAHRIEFGSVYELGGKKFVDGQRATHEEHNAVTLTGDYEIRIQREYDDEQEYRQVVD